MKKSWPSVTQVLGVFTDFSMIREDVLKHAAERGTKIHSAIAAHLLGLWSLPLDIEAQPYFDSFRRWADLMVDKVVFVEEEIVCDCYGFKGHPDATLILKGESLATVIDWKSPISEAPTWELQLSGYSHLVEKHYKPNTSIGRCGCVMLSPKGSQAKMKEYSANRNTAFSVFLAALTVFNYLK